MKLNQKYIIYGFMAIHTIFIIISFILLPSELVMQLAFSGEPGTVLPKFVGLGLMLILVLYANVRLNKEEKGSNNLLRLTLINLIFLALEITIFVWNI
ncbi:MAG: hypothetical protein AB7U79_06350 [Candidatus Izemoplasmatales bacterium]